MGAAQSICYGAHDTQKKVVEKREMLSEKKITYSSQSNNSIKIDFNDPQVQSVTNELLSQLIISQRSDTSENFTTPHVEKSSPISQPLTVPKIIEIEANVDVESSKMPSIQTSFPIVSYQETFDSEHSPMLSEKIMAQLSLLQSPTFA